MGWYQDYKRRVERREDGEGLRIGVHVPLGQLPTTSTRLTVLRPNMAEPAWQEILRVRLVERNARESAYSSIIEQCAFHHTRPFTTTIYIVL